MTRGSKFRSLAAVLGALSIAAACGGGTTTTTSETLAADQTLSFPINDDVGDLDPAHMSAAVDIDLFQNVFSGLYKFNSKLEQVPDIATGPPVISNGGLTYTFTMRHDAKFSNGDPIKADDFIYSWNRAARIQGDYASVFAPIAGYDDVAAGKATTMTGLKRIDDYSFSATLSAPAGYWYTEVALWTAWVVDQKAITAGGGDNTWFTNLTTFVGSGQFKMTGRVPKTSLDFEPVANWYGGSTGALKKVHIEVIADQKASLTKYESGNFSLIGFMNQNLTPEDVIRYNSDPQLKAQLTLQPAARTTWIGFNLKTGPFAGIDAGKHGRHAFITAVDLSQLVDIACSKGTACTAATGGTITKGLQGYLGDNADPNSKFDAAAAKAEYQAWDPTGSKVKGLVYTYNATAFNKAVCENLASQWQKNLGVTMQCAAQDRASFFSARNKCTYPIFRHSWSADYDHPQDWFDFLFVTGAGSGGSCYSNPALDSLVKNANAKPLTESLADYKKAGQMLIDDSVAGNLVYTVQQYVVHPYVKGAGGNALYDNRWSDVRILQH
ncbi:MAG TPA: peptide ABC transporter substrate-binding protein [Candidatus Dormibacteraeota bacterium]|nr:peptide ABC transporter substrate-binding protein [Candidatus Dormibacteraeota bacterium]